MDTALSTLKLMPFSSVQVAEFAQQIETSLLSGDVNPLELAIYFKAIEKVAESVKETMQRLSIQEAEKYGKGEFVLMGAKIQVKELGTRYDYSGTGDVIYQRLSEQKGEIDAKIKERESISKLLSSPLE